MKIILAAACAAALAGCVSAGTRVDPTSLAAFQDGTTTVAQVEKKLGTPEKSSVNSDGTTTLAYVYSKASPDAVDFVPLVNLFAAGEKAQQVTVTFRFDRNGRLLGYTTQTQQTHAHASAF